MEEGIFITKTDEVPGGFYWGKLEDLRAGKKFVRLHDLNGDGYVSQETSKVVSGGCISIPRNHLLSTGYGNYIIPECGMYVKSKTSPESMGDYIITRIWLEPDKSKLTLALRSIKADISRGDLAVYTEAECDQVYYSENQPEPWEANDVVRWKTNGLTGKVVRRSLDHTSVRFQNDDFSGVLDILNIHLEKVNVTHMWKLEVSEDKPTVVLTDRPSIGSPVRKEVPLEAVINFIRKLPN